MLPVSEGMVAPVWNPHVLCDGVPAGHRAGWCVDHLGHLEVTILHRHNELTKKEC